MKSLGGAELSMFIYVLLGVHRHDLARAWFQWSCSFVLKSSTPFMFGPTWSGLQRVQGQNNWLGIY